MINYIYNQMFYLQESCGYYFEGVRLWRISGGHRRRI